MKAIKAFKATIARSRSLVQLHQRLCPRGAPRAEYSDVLRAAVVLSVSAMDAYFHDKICEKIVPLVRAREGKNLPGRLMETIKAGASHDRLLQIMFEERPLAHVTTIVRSSLADATIQNAGKIDQALKMIGCDDAWFHAAQAIGKSKKAIRRFIQPYVDRRHRIVHEGDVGTGKKDRHRLRKITRLYAGTAIDRIEQFVDAIDAFIEQKIPSQ